MSWENVRAAETYAMATFELCNTLREVHGFPPVDYREKLNFEPSYYPKWKRDKWTFKEVDNDTKKVVLGLATKVLNQDIVSYYGDSFYVNRPEQVVLKICKPKKEEETC